MNSPKFASRLVLALLTPASLQISSAISFTPLQDLAGGANESYGNSISADGTTVIGRSTSASGPEATKWNLSGTPTALGDLSGGAFDSTAIGVSGDGGVIVGVGKSADSAASRPVDDEGFIWTQATGMMPIGDYSGSVFNSGALSVSSDGNIVTGFASSDQGRLAVRKIGSGPLLDDVNGSIGSGILAHATDISADGSVITGRTEGHGVTGVQPYIWTEATGRQLLGDLPGGIDYATGNAISADGTTVVGNSSVGSGEEEAFIWTQASGMVNIGDLAGGAKAGVAYDVSGDGSIVVGQGASALGNEAFIWDSVNGMRNLKSVLELDFGLALELQGWTLSAARGITPDGLKIVGYGINPFGEQQGWAVDLQSSSVPDSGPNIVGVAALLAVLVSAKRLAHATSQLALDPHDA